MAAKSVWKYAVRLDESSTPTHLARMLDYWGHGPANASARIAAATSHSPAGISGSSGNTQQDAAQQQQQQQQPNSISNYSNASASLFRTPVSSHYVVFACADGYRFLVSHSVARMCDTLISIMDDLDLEGGGVDVSAGSSPVNRHTGGPSSSSSPAGNRNNNGNALSADQIAAQLCEDCAVLEIALSGQTLEAVLVYMSLCLEHGAASTLPYPLGAPLSSLITEWEQTFLTQYAPHLHYMPPQLATTASSAAPTPATVAAKEDNGGLMAAGGGGRTSPFSAPSFSLHQQQQLQQSSASTAAAGSSNNGAYVPPCPPLISLLRAADYLAIHSLKDLAAASLADGLLTTRDESQLAAMLGLAKLPKEQDLAEIYSRFPFLNPGKLGGKSSTSSSGQPM